MKRTIDTILLLRCDFYRRAKHLARTQPYKTLRRWQAMISLFDSHYRNLLSVGKLPLWKFQLYTAELQRKTDLYAQAIDFQGFPHAIPNCLRPDYYDPPEKLLSLVTAPLPKWLLNIAPKLNLYVSMSP